MEINEDSNYYLIKIDQKESDFGKKLAAIKSLPGHQWHGHARIWTIPRRNYSDVSAVIMAIQKKMNRVKQVHRELPIDPLPELTVDVPLKKPMYHFQKQGVAYNLEKGSALIGDQQGLGKTLQAIATVVALNLFPCLVITKKSLILNWMAEWKEFTDKTIEAFTPSKKNTWQFFFKTGLQDVGIINYESLQPYFVNKIDVPAGEKLRVKHIQFREEIKMFKSVIIDESHYVKDGATKRTKFCIGITSFLKERGVFLLSGTPVLNDPMEIYTQLTMMNRQQHFGKYTEFKDLYSGKHNRGNLAQLNYLLHKHCYYRRLKSEAKADLPPKTRQIMQCEIDNREEYDNAENDFRAYLQDKLAMNGGQIDKRMQAEIMVQMGVLKKIAARGKLAAIKEWVNDLMEQDEKLVLYAYHKEIQADLVASFKGAVNISSQDVTPMEVIQRNKELFMTTKDHNVIVCSISAAAEGHTLNAASNLGMCELPWHFGKAEQCEDRIHRITNWLPANITYFLGKDTIDEKIYKIIMSKKDMHDKVTGSGNDQEEETKVIDQLVGMFAKRAV